MIRDLIHAIPKLISEDVSTAKATFACIGVGLGLSVYGVMAYWPVSTSRQLIGNLLAGSCVLAIAYSGYFHGRRVVAACLYGLLFGVGIPGSVTVLIAGLASLF